ncbi:ClpXP protease specificity-enhancing factor [Parendozoicomonas haliclonae]|uniref:Stringent starvation protein B n=1 Tax=Parendozoicomonas haliclonae TaxID=1960125 RepID=A0A1X7AEW5_9GAMM|nr:ClpXP protease specificity-enhancing factor [Parendozoicomonas haliclonae]SMA34038.1 Stringent starvation protein B [Parendozoicomonas haliclonae]
MSMTSSRPYIIRALYDWIVENDCTPYLLVDSHWPGVHLPDRFADDDQVVLNVSPLAVRELELGNDAISFMTRFGGVAYHVYVPSDGVMAIYARENGQGMVFEMDAYPEQEEGVIVEDAPVVESALKPVTALKSVDSSDDDKTPPPPKGGGRPSLKVVK